LFQKTWVTAIFVESTMVHINFYQMTMSDLEIFTTTAAMGLPGHDRGNDPKWHEYGRESENDTNYINHGKPFSLCRWISNSWSQQL